jgi:enterochelin esterase-like enzyme
LLAQGKVVPMVVVIPETHALPPEAVPGPGSPEFTNYTNDNAVKVDQELFTDIIPFVTAHYRVRWDAAGHALAGLSLGAIQTEYTGLLHSDYFSALGVFSGGIITAPNSTVTTTIENALGHPAKINRDIRYFYLVAGGQDIALPFTQAFAQQLDAAGIHHVFEVIPGQLHTMFVWRPALYNFVQHIFTRPF